MKWRAIGQVSVTESNGDLSSAKMQNFELNENLLKSGEKHHDNFKFIGVQELWEKHDLP